MDILRRLKTREGEWGSTVLTRETPQSHVLSGKPTGRVLQLPMGIKNRHISHYSARASVTVHRLAYKRLAFRNPT